MGLAALTMLQQSADSARERQRNRILLARRFTPRVSPETLRPSPMRSAVTWLYPWLDKPPGLYGLLMPLLGCSVVSLKHWLSGRREMPTRIRLILISTIRNRLESGAAILAELEAVPVKPIKPPAFHGAKARRAKAQDDAAKLDALPEVQRPK